MIGAAHEEKSCSYASGRVKLRPLAVDLDGTLIRTDLLHEALLELAKASPWVLVNLLFSLIKGKAAFKQRVAELAPIDVQILPYEHELIEWLRAEREAGRQIVLATASNESYARAVAEHLGIFDEVLSSNDRTNLAGPVKRDLLVQKYGERRFAYAGNAAPDLQVWSHSSAAVLVNASARLSRRVAATTPIERTFGFRSEQVFKTWLRALRIQQWLKNLLVFVPLVMSHRIAEPGLLPAAGLAFLAFGLVASGTYVLNDLLDLRADRLHLRKRTRPFAAGHLQAWQGALALVLLVALGIAISMMLPPFFVAAVGGYLFLTIGYSLSWKRIAVLDVFLLAVLYTTRIIAGGSAVAVVPSFWLLAFSMFLFLSLAILKRFVELRAIGLNETDRMAAGRGYVAGDVAIMSSLGVASGVVAALVLALYVNSPGIHDLYSTASLIWLACPLFLFWISHTWLKAHRGEVHDDPVVFALTDRGSLTVAILIAAVFYLAR